MDQQTAMILETLPANTEGERPAEPSHSTLAEVMGELRQELVGGLLYTHHRANANTSRVLEFAAFLYGLIEILQEQGLVTVEELDARKSVVAERLERRFREKGMGVHLQEPEQDKYSVRGGVQINCEERLPLCKAACCRMWFPLSQQDVEEGVVRWDLRQPYIIAQDSQGYCQHLDRGACHCTIYAQRPLPCRVFDCRTDKRIWADFENKVINPNLEDLFQGRVPSEP